MFGISEACVGIGDGVYEKDKNNLFTYKDPSSSLSQ